MYDYQYCIIGSGAGASPIAYELAKVGKKVVVLEKGPWMSEKDFYKDEQACCLHNSYTPQLQNEQHVIEDQDEQGNWYAEPTSESGWSFWNGNVVGGSSNFMSGFFYRLKPEDFALASTFGPIEGANIADWPIDYAQFEPYYRKVEQEIGISGRVVPHKHQEPRSTPDFPLPPTLEHPISKQIDQACQQLGITPLPTPRAILSRPWKGRKSCEYSGFCGSYGCSSGAKGSGRAALLDDAVKTGNCTLIPWAKVGKLQSDHRGKITHALYTDRNKKTHHISAEIFIVACQAIETSRLLLMSPGPKHPNGLANNHNQVGKNLLFSAGGSGSGDFDYKHLSPKTAQQFHIRGPFINRGIQDWYFINDKNLGGKQKGGTIDFLLRHPNPLSKASYQLWDENDKMVWGKKLQQQLYQTFAQKQTLRFEVFNDWLPNDNCFVSLDKQIKDQWGDPVARIRIGYHPHDLKIGRFLTQKAVTVLKKMGASNIQSHVSGAPPANLVAGGCRFGTDIRSSVLNANCQAHDVENLYISDGSFMPTGGSVPYTWTIYANAFRIADILLGKRPE